MPIYFVMMIVKIPAKYSLPVTLLPIWSAFQDIDKIGNYLFNGICVKRWIKRDG